MTVSFSLKRFTLSIDEGAPYWQCSVELTNAEEALELKPNDLFVLTILSEEYWFYVDKISINKTGPVDISATISGLGKGADLDTPRKEAITKTWKEDKSAREILDELLEGRIVQYDLVDWVIIGGRLSVENASRLSVAKQIVEAAGGVLEGTPAGDFVIRRLFPVPPKDYEITAPYMIFDEVTDLYNSVEAYENNRYVDWVRIRDIAESGIQDFVETVFDEGSQTSGKIYVYPMPWRQVRVEHTSFDFVQLSFVEEQVRQETEVIEIFQGEGSTKYPIVSIDSVVWQAIDLMSLYSSPFSKRVFSSHPTEKNSMVEIVYTTKALVYNMACDADLTVQFLVIDDN